MVKDCLEFRNAIAKSVALLAERAALTALGARAGLVAAARDILDRQFWLQEVELATRSLAIITNPQAIPLIVCGERWSSALFDFLCPRVEVFPTKQRRLTVLNTRTCSDGP